MANLFLSVAEKKLGHFAGAKKHFDLAKTYLESSEFWRLRFAAFGLDGLLDSA